MIDQDQVGQEVERRMAFIVGRLTVEKTVAETQRDALAAQVGELQQKLAELSPVTPEAPQ